MKKAKGAWIFFIIVAGLLVNAIFRFAAWLILSCQLYFDVQNSLLIYLQRTEADSYFVMTMFLIALIVRAVRHLRK